MVGEKKMDKKIILLLLIGIVYSSTTDKIGVGIKMDASAPFGQNSVGLLEIRLKLKNLNTKTIKYMTLEIDAYNRVGDLLTPWPGTSSCRVTGPIVYNKVRTTKGCTAYYKSMVAEIKVRVSNVEYMDGTINNIPTDYYIVNRKAQTIEFNKVVVMTTIGGMLLGFLLIGGL